MPTDNRLSRLEAVVEGIGRDLDTLTRTVQSLADRVGDRSQTDWRAMAAWATVILAVVALGGSGFVRDLTRVEGNQKDMMSAFVAHISDGHPRNLRDIMDRNRIDVDKNEDRISSNVSRFLTFQQQSEEALGRIDERLRAVERRRMGME
jgi:hypothetical protein